MAFIVAIVVEALLYRLSGDYNPLHSDSTVAAMAGFNRPILHGLCTLGFAIRAIIRSVCNGNPTVVRSIFARFLLHVFPGDSDHGNLDRGTQDHISNKGEGEE
ncbi:hypothetical protein HPP92_013971 [Vanilla planifolia]|uniref:MaoC-like domain-containing protein n=1 Tax=Vanilla planifolia TaxID=51239 RepID=A0A835QQ18_VANPL|nr:hypothetical protein HPP92_013971 [Vanilla planifolia]